MHGLIIRNTGSWYTVKTDDGRIVEYKVKGNFRLKGIRSTSPVAMGDYVDIIMNAEGAALISAVDDHKNYIIRKASNLSKQSQIITADLDQVLLIITIKQPETSTTFIDRFFAGAEAYRVPVVLVFNKTDLLNDDERRYQQQMVTLYETIGYPCVEISAETGMGTDQLQTLLKQKVALVSGNNGVGKSTLISAITPRTDQRTAEISSAHGTGMHTTTFSEMIELAESGYLIDTPGIKGFGTFGIEREELTSCSKEIFEFFRDCKLNNCTYIHEPGCAVIQAIENHYISVSRYQSYLNMLEDKDDSKYRTAY